MKNETPGHTLQANSEAPAPKGTLGHEFGGAIGIVVFLAQSVSIAFYCLGFGEVIAYLIQTDINFLPQIIAAAAVSFLFIFAWLGADWATKFQYVVMAVLFAAIISFFIGGFIRWDAELLGKNWSSPQPGLSFWVLFAIFQYLKRTGGPMRWADSRRSYHLQLTREHLMAAAAEPEHPRDWRPQILAFSDNPHRRAQLLRFSSWIEGESGLTTAVRILEGEGVKMRQAKEEAEKLADQLARKAAKATAKAETAVKEAEDAGILPEEPEKEEK